MAHETMDKNAGGLSWACFLGDVLVCSLGAYGGPEAHYGVFTQQMVQRRRYLTEDELGELIGLTAIIPGPSSTQTLVSIGYKVGGPVLAFLTLLVWALPVVLLLTGLTFAYQGLEALSLDSRILEPVGALAVAFIFSAAWNLGAKTLKKPLEVALWAAAVALSFFFRMVWVFPALLATGALVMVLAHRQEGLWKPVKLSPPWGWLITFVILAGGLWAASSFLPLRPLWILDHFFRYGYLIIGGGQVVVPYMYSELVEGYHWMSSAEFLTGFGLVQGLPGPMFSFAAWAGGLASRGAGPGMQVAGALAGAVGIFLPGTLLMYFVYPLWTQLREVPGLKVALRGITVVAVGLITSAGLVLLRDQGVAPLAWGISAAGFAALQTRKVPAPLLVLAALGLGVVLYGPWARVS